MRDLKSGLDTLVGPVDASFFGLRTKLMRFQLIARDGQSSRVWVGSRTRDDIGTSQVKGILGPGLIIGWDTLEVSGGQRIATWVWGVPGTFPTRPGNTRVLGVISARDQRTV